MTTNKFFQVAKRFSNNGTLLDLATIEQLPSGKYNVIYGYSNKEHKFNTAEGAVAFLTKHNYN